MVPEQSEIKTAGKRILILQSNLSGYVRNQLATPYLNWKLSRDVFHHPEFYENITAVYHHLRLDPPDEIIDPENLMSPFMERIPALRKAYRRQGSSYIKN
jgi:hypothetical protein